MPRQLGASDEYTEMLEDVIAGMLSARENLDDFYALVSLLRQKSMISATVYHEYKEKLDKIADALQTGKRSTAALRNRREL